MSDAAVPAIDETKAGLLSQEIKSRRLGGKICIYYPDVACAVPRLQFKICRVCPKCAPYIRKNVVQSLFQHIKSLAISLMNSMNIQLSK